MRRLVGFILAASPVFGGESAVFPPDSTWETLSGGHQIVEGIASAGGNLYLTDVPDRELFRIKPDGTSELMDGATDAANGLAIGPGGRLFGACMHAPAMLVWDLDSGKRTSIPLPTPANDLAITAQGWVFYTWGAANGVYQFQADSPAVRKVVELPHPNGITLSHDGRELWVGEFHGDSVRAFPILEDGRLGQPVPGFMAKTPADGKGLLDGMTPLKDGRLLVATALGLQILERGKEPLLLANPTARRANYVRLVTDPQGVRWMIAAFEKSVMRRKTRL